MRDIDIIKRIKKVEHKKGYVNKTTGGYVLNTGKFQYFNDLNFSDLSHGSIGLIKSIEGNYNNTVAWGTRKGINEVRNTFKNVYTSGFSEIEIELIYLYGTNTWSVGYFPFSYYVAPEGKFIYDFEILEASNVDLHIVAFNEDATKIDLRGFEIPNDVRNLSFFWCNINYPCQNGVLKRIRNYIPYAFRAIKLDYIRNNMRRKVKYFFNRYYSRNKNKARFCYTEEELIYTSCLQEECIEYAIAYDNDCVRDCCLEYGDCPKHYIFCDPTRQNCVNCYEYPDSHICCSLCSYTYCAEYNCVCEYQLYEDCGAENCPIEQINQDCANRNLAVGQVIDKTILVYRYLYNYSFLYNNENETEEDFCILSNESNSIFFNMYDYNPPAVILALALKNPDKELEIAPGPENDYCYTCNYFTMRLRVYLAPLSILL